MDTVVNKNATREPADLVPGPHRSTTNRGRTVNDTRLQLILSGALIIASWITIRPLGVTGVDGLVTVLLAVNSLFILGRNVDPGRVSPQAGLALLCGWAVLAAALLSLRSLGLAAAFGYFVAGHAGYRLAARPALMVAAGVGVLSALGLRIAQNRGVDGWPWLLGLTVALPVFLGMANRSRDLAVASALAAADAAQRAAESEARARALAERARISRDIHDVLAHSLSGVSMQLELSEMLLDEQQIDRARQAIERAHSMVREGMVEAKRAVTALRADVLPLPQTLQAQFDGVTQVIVTGQVRVLSTEISQTLVRSAQEALTNIRRHAPGAPLRVRLCYLDAAVQLEVTNGPAHKAGGAAAQVASAGMGHRQRPGRLSEGSGMGLVGMRERAALLNGTVEVGPVIDGPWQGGWRVAVTIPE